MLGGSAHLCSALLSLYCPHIALAPSAEAVQNMILPETGRPRLQTSGAGPDPTRGVSPGVSACAMAKLGTWQKWAEGVSSL